MIPKYSLAEIRDGMAQNRNEWGQLDRMVQECAEAGAGTALDCAYDYVAFRDEFRHKLQSSSATDVRKVLAKIYKSFEKNFQRRG